MIDEKWYKLFNSPTFIFEYDLSDPEEKRNFEETREALEKKVDNYFFIEVREKEGLILIWRVKDRT